MLSVLSSLFLLKIFVSKMKQISIAVIKLKVRTGNDINDTSSDIAIHENRKYPQMLSIMVKLSCLVFLQ